MNFWLTEEIEEIRRQLVPRSLDELTRYNRSFSAVSVLVFSSKAIVLKMESIGVN